MLILNENDSEQTFAVTTGDDIVITLSENPTTGFQWSVESVDGNLEIVSSEFEAPSGGQPGASGRRTVRLRATGHASGELTLRYARQRDSSGDAARRCRFFFKIKSA